MTAKNKTTLWVRLGDYIEECDERNLEGLPLPFYGINKQKTFMPTVADTNQLDNSKYKVVGQGYLFLVECKLDEINVSAWL